MYLEQLSSTGFLLREAINKQIFIETLLLKAMRMAHAVQVDDLIARLNYIRKNGELAPLNAVPAYVTLPPPQVIVQTATNAAPVPVPAEAEKKTADPLPAPVTPAVPPQTTQSPEPVEDLPPPAPMPEPERTTTVPEPVIAETHAEPAPVPVPPSPALKEESETEDFDDEEPGTEPLHQELDINQLLGKRKSVEELISEVKDVPLVQNIINGFRGRIVDVHEITEE